MLHHVELWVENLSASIGSLGWLLLRLGYTVDATWPTGISYRSGDFYLVIESGPDVLPSRHERRAPGLNHLAFHAGTRAQVDALTTDAMAHGFELMFSDSHPFAGGPAHYAAYLHDSSGFEVELVAAPAV